MKKNLILPVVALLGTMTFSACSNDNNDNGGREDDVFNIVTTSPIVDNDS